MKISWFLSAILLAGTACASSPKSSEVAVVESGASPAKGEVAQNDKATADDDEMICVKENVVGSNIPKRQCRSKAQLERERREAQEEMRRQQRQNPTAN